MIIILISIKVKFSTGQYYVYICVCKAISDSDIDEAVIRGEVSSVECLSRHFGVATGCGCCRDAAEDCLEEAMEKCRAARSGAGAIDQLLTG